MIKNKSTHFVKILLLGLFLIVGPSLTQAASFSVSPLIVDLEAKARDTFIHDIKLKNNENHYLRVYASVNEIEVGESNEIKEFITPSMSDRSNTITSWLEITRGRIELKDGEEKTIPLTVRINPDAKPGLYHAYVGFASGANRDEAQNKVIEGQGSGVLLRIVVGSKQVEFLRLVSFSTDRFSFSPDKGLINYILENTGDVPLAPKGDITIYDGRGKELTTVPLGSETDPEMLAPGERKAYTVALPFTDRIGRNKAFLNIEYGEVNRAAVYDTDFYFSLPWSYLIVIMILLVLIATVLVLLMRRSSKGEVYDSDEAYVLPLYVGKEKVHSEYDHDINLKSKDS